MISALPFTTTVELPEVKVPLLVKAVPLVVVSVSVRLLLSVVSVPPLSMVIETIEGLVSRVMVSPLKICTVSAVCGPPKSAQATSQEALLLQLPPPVPLD